MPQLPSLPEPSNLTDLMVRFSKNVAPLMAYVNAVLRSEGALSIAERELIAAYVSGLNACRLCLGSHAIYARAFGIPEGTVEALLADIDTAPVEDRLKPLFAYVAKLNTLPSRMVPADAAAVLAAGLSEEALFEAIEVCGLFNLMNRLIEGAGVNFDYAADRGAHTIRIGDTDALSASYLTYAERIARMVAEG